MPLKSNLSCRTCNMLYSKEVQDEQATDHFSNLFHTLKRCEQCSEPFYQTRSWVVWSLAVFKWYLMNPMLAEACPDFLTREVCSTWAQTWMNSMYLSILYPNHKVTFPYLIISFWATLWLHTNMSGLNLLGLKKYMTKVLFWSDVRKCARCQPVPAKSKQQLIST